MPAAPVTAEPRTAAPGTADPTPRPLAPTTYPGYTASPNAGKTMDASEVRGMMNWEINTDARQGYPVATQLTPLVASP